jgi:hypothetical protein
VPPGFVDAGEVGLFIDNVTAHNGRSWAAERFRKIKPDAEPCEEEFAVLIKCGRAVAA